MRAGASEGFTLSKPIAVYKYGKPFKAERVALAVDGSELPFVRLEGDDASVEVYFSQRGGGGADFRAAFQFVALLQHGVVQTVQTDGIYFAGLCIELKDRPILGTGAPEEGSPFPTLKIGEPVTSYLAGTSLSDEGRRAVGTSECRIQK